MKTFLISIVILILGATLGVCCYSAYQHFQTKADKSVKTAITVEKRTGIHRLDMKLAVTDAEKDFFAMMNNYFDVLDKAVDDKRQGRKTNFKKINFLEAKIGLWFLFNEDKIRKELMRKELLPLVEYYEQITQKYGIDQKLEENALIKTPKPKKEPVGLVYGPSRSYTKSIYVKNGRTYDSIIVSDTYIYRTNNGKLKRVNKNASYAKVDLNDYFNPEEADWNCTGLSDEEYKYLKNKNVEYCDTTIQNNKLKGWYHITKWTETK